MATPGQQQTFQSLGRRVRELNRLDAHPGESVAASEALLKRIKAALRAARLSSDPTATNPERRSK